jgi:hypothetical protein
MIVKLHLPEKCWYLINDLHAEEPDAFEKILRDNFFSRIHEFVHDYNIGFVNEMRARFRPILRARFVYLPYSLVVKLEEQLSENGWLKDFVEFEYLISYCIMLSTAETVKKLENTEGYS